MPLFGPPNVAQMEAKRDIQGLIKTLTYKDAAIRRAAAEALAPMKDPRAVEPLSQAMHDTDPTVRKACADALAERGGLRVVDPLVNALIDPSPDVRNSAATAVYRRLMTEPEAEVRKATCAALGRTNNPASVEPLLKAVLDVDDDVRLAAVRSLHAQGDTRAVEPLLVVLAFEKLRAQRTSRFSPALEQATTAALDALCDASAIDALRGALSHDDAQVREMAVRRLGRIQSPDVFHPLIAALRDPEPRVRGLAARVLQELSWQPSADETGARYWAALRQWQRCAESGPVSIPFLVEGYEQANDVDKADIVNSLVKLGWEPTEETPLAARYWVARERWDKCIEIGPAAVEALDDVLRHATRWRDRVAGAEALAELGQPRQYPFQRLDLVDRALAIIDGADGADKQSAFAALLTSELELDPEKGESAVYCTCGYPASRVRGDGTRAPISELLGYESAGSNETTYYCPNCDSQIATVSE